MPARLISLLLALAYPVLVFASLSYGNLSALSIILMVLGAARLLMTLIPGHRAREGQLAGSLLIVLGALVWWSEAELTARLYPVIVNFGLLCWFVYSLFHPPTVIERIARLTEPDLPDHAIAYTRSVTLVWSLFFLANGTAALYTSLYSSLQLWTLYNGLIAYLLMGLLFAIEYLVRRRTRQRHERG